MLQIPCYKTAPLKGDLQSTQLLISRPYHENQLSATNSLSTFIVNSSFISLLCCPFSFNWFAPLSLLPGTHT